MRRPQPARYAPGWPRLAFSADGERIFASGMGNRSTLGGWRLPPEDLPRTPHWWTHGRRFPGGGAAFLFDNRSGRYEVQKPPGTPVGSGVVQLSQFNLAGDGPIASFFSPDSGSVFVEDLAADRVLWRHACRMCQNMSVSADASVLAFVDADGLEVWDTRADRRLFQAPRRNRALDGECAVTRDGRRVAWNQVENARVRDLDTEREKTIPLDGPISQLQFSPDPDQLLTITTRTITLWDARAGRTIWSRPTDAAGLYNTRWSPERNAIIVERGNSATEVLDWETGERLAWFEALSRVVTPVAGEFYANDLRLKAVGNLLYWDTRAVPQPDETPAAESLTRTLQRTGLEFRGVELVAAP